jgi:5'-nucleotidase
MPVTAARLATIALLSVVAAAACAAEYTAARAPRAAASAPYRILVTNDDGIESPGLAALVDALAPLGEVTIVAPYENQSGIGHALNLREPIFLMRREVAGRPAVALSGTPATCVRVATDHLMKEAPPDLVVSGVNRGLNFGRNTYVSGTVAAAREAALQGIAAIAVSLAREAHPDYSGAASAAAEVAAIVKEHGLPPAVFLNVNVPASPTRRLQLTHQSLLAGTEHFELHRNPYGRPYLWSFFEQPETGAEPGSDIAAVRSGAVAVTPLQAHESASAALEALSGLFEGTGAARAAPRDE